MAGSTDVADLPDLKLGKKPATKDTRDLLFSTFKVSGVKLARAPVGFGHGKLIPGNNWGMLGNDKYGDCVMAAADHGTMLWNAIAGKQVKFTEQNTLSDYSAVTGFNPANPDSDQGTNMRDALNYRRSTGMVDASGQRHKIGGYVAIEPQNFTQVLEALDIFDLVEIGFEVPEYAMYEFNEGRPWSLTHDRGSSNIIGGHDVICEGRPHAETLQAVTWGTTTNMSEPFFKKYVDEAYGILSEESLVNGRTAEGYDLNALREALSAF